jgi:hypothetical protein
VRPVALATDIPPRAQSRLRSVVNSVTQLPNGRDAPQVQPMQSCERASSISIESPNS